MKRVSPLAWLGWLLGTLAVFAFLEGTAMYDHAANDTLTRTIVRYVPWPVGLAVWALLAGAAFWHWSIEYRRHSGR